MEKYNTTECPICKSSINAEVKVETKLSDITVWVNPQMGIGDEERGGPHKIDVFSGWDDSEHVSFGAVDVMDIYCEGDPTHEWQDMDTAWRQRAIEVAKEDDK